jgi:hypothetical protein
MQGQATADGTLTARRRPGDPPGREVLVDTAFDARATDADPIYLQAILAGERVPARFDPWRPGEHWGPLGPQSPLRLMVATGSLGEAAAVMADILPLDSEENYQARLADPNVAFGW